MMQDGVTVGLECFGTGVMIRRIVSQTKSNEGVRTGGELMDTPVTVSFCF